MHPDLIPVRVLHGPGDDLGPLDADVVDVGEEVLHVHEAPEVRVAELSKVTREQVVLGDVVTVVPMDDGDPMHHQPVVA